MLIQMLLDMFLQRCETSDSKTLLVNESINKSVLEKSLTKDSIDSNYILIIYNGCYKCDEIIDEDKYNIKCCDVIYCYNCINKYDIDIIQIECSICRTLLN